MQCASRDPITRESHGRNALRILHPYIALPCVPHYISQSIPLYIVPLSSCTLREVSLTFVPLTSLCSTFLSNLFSRHVCTILGYNSLSIVQVNNSLLKPSLLFASPHTLNLFLTLTMSLDQDILPSPTLWQFLRKLYHSLLVFHNHMSVLERK